MVQLSEMKITKDLKHATFEYDEEAKSFTIMCDGDIGPRTCVTLNKVYAFAFMRFVVRMAQRNWLRRKKIQITEPTPEESSDLIDGAQLVFDKINVLLSPTP